MNKEIKFILDAKDKAILYELDLDSRQPCKQIGKKLRLSPEVVNYRIKRLEEEGIITTYQTIIGLSLLGIIQFKLCISLQHMDSAKLNRIIGQLKQKDEVKWVAECKGPWDILISMETHTIEGINMLKEEVLSLFTGHIDKKAISILVEAETYSRDYLTGKEAAIGRRRLIMKEGEALKINNLDMNILKQLAKDGRKPITKISKSLNETPRVIAYRIQQLRKLGIIQGFKVALEYEKLGIKFCKALVYLDSATHERINALNAYLSKNRNVIHNAKVIAAWDIEPEFEAFSEEEIENAIRDIKDKFSDIIKSIDTVTISKEHKFVYF